MLYFQVQSRISFFFNWENVFLVHTLHILIVRSFVVEFFIILYICLYNIVDHSNKMDALLLLFSVPMLTVLRRFSIVMTMIGEKIVLK